MSGASIDALPYYDKQVEDPALKARAQALIEAELGNTPPVADDDPRLPADIEVFKSPALAELLANYPEERINGIDASKYQPPSVPEGASVDVLAEAERRGRIGVSHMAVRNDNIGVLQQYGPNAWLVRNYQLNAEVTELKSTLTALKENVTEVNRERRVFQEDAGEHLTRLEDRWGDLVRSTVQLEMACKAMEGEVRNLRSREEELREEVAELEASA